MKPAQPTLEAHPLRALLWRLLLSQLCVLLLAVYGQAADDVPPLSRANATVLLRLKTNLNGRPTDLSGDFLYGLAQVESGELMHPVVPIPATSRDPEGQWLYLELPSGSYHFWLIPPRTELKRYRFQFAVADGQPVVYVGTIQFNCWSKSAFFGGALDFCWDQTAVVNEAQLAQPIAASVVGKDMPLASSLMQPYGLPPPKDLFARLEPISMVMRSGLDGLSADWSNRPPTKRSADPAVGAAVMLLSPFCVGYAGFVGIGTCFLLGLANVVAAAHDTHTESRQNEQFNNQWTACQKILQQELAGRDAENSLRQRLSELLKLPSTATSNPTPAQEVALPQGPPANSHLETEILQAIMRECRGRDSLCLGLKVRVRLWSEPERKYVYDWVFLQPQGSIPSRWSEDSSFPWWDMPFYNYDVPVSASDPTTRTIDAYCGEDGAKLLNEDLRAAVAASAIRIQEFLARQR